MADDSLTLKGETCPVCLKKTLTLAETSMEVPYFGRLFIFSLDCQSCDFRKADLEAEEPKEPAKYTFDIESKEDLDVRVIKSAEALVKIPHLASIEPGPASEGYVTNVEGIVMRMKAQIEAVRDMADDPAQKKKAKNLLKKVHKILNGSQPIKLIVEDVTGNSAIISERAQRQKLKK